MGPADIVASFNWQSELYVITERGDVWRWDEQETKWIKVGAFGRDPIE